MRTANPVWPGYFADPFVLRYGGEYYAYGTGEHHARDAAGGAHAFPVLRSRDLVTWTAAGHALAVPPAMSQHAFWAPEVVARDGRYYCYYSCAPTDHDELHRIRVATADHPLGPFVEQGAVLPENTGFCIDAHPFRDPRDDTWYLYFARDYFDARVGTGLAVVRLTDDLLRAASDPREVLRANADWQIYERNRNHYGRLWAAWHTIEGPCVVAHGGRYYCFYSGGNWRTRHYGVSYAIADHPLGPWRHASDEAPVVLHGRTGELLGPGHNSHVIGPDGRSEFLAYHAWDIEYRARRMCIDPLIWTENGPRCVDVNTAPFATEVIPRPEPR